MKLLVIENPRPLTLEHYNDVANAPLSASLNSGYALAVAGRAGWDTAYLDLSADTGETADRAARIRAEEGDLILFHWVYSWGHEDSVCEIMELLRRCSTTRMGAFGLFPTLAGQHLLQYAAQLDFILAGEFEDTLAELLNGFEKNRLLTALPGITLRDCQFIPRPLIDDLTCLPVPEDVGANCSYNSMNVAASRGCHGACSFCFIHRFYGCSRRRVRPLASLAQELERRLTRRSIDNLYFIDPSFIGQGDKELERVTEISRLAHSLALPFGFETRVDSINEGVLATLAKHGASSVFLGIESGCDAVLQRIGKRVDKQQVSRAIRTVQGSGIQLTVGFIMFEPDTTLAELSENYSFLEGMGLLNDHDLTANLLYHNQIILYGSTAWERFERERRLRIDPRLPFEARYLFRDERVELVCSAMGRLTAQYFKGIDNSRRHTTASGWYDCSVDHPKEACSDELNLLLKAAFQEFCSVIKNPQSKQLATLEEGYLRQMRSLLT